MSLNKVMLIGNLGQDPEIRYTQSGSAVANLRIATTDVWKDKQGQRQERTEWHSIVAWDRLADLAQNYLKKGRQIYVEGRLQTRSWEDQQGQKRFSTEIVANVIQFLGSRPEGEANTTPSQNYGNAPSSTEQHPNEQPDGPPPGEDYIKDDIPF